MRGAGIIPPVLVAAAVGLWVGTGPATPADPPAGGGAGFPRFKTQEIDTALSIGYAVLVADINGDQKPDIVVVDQLKVVWYENPTWKKRVILDGKTKPDNVCAAAVDIDGDGQLDLVLGAGWKPFDTANPGTLQWLKRGKTLDEEWTMYPIPCDEPMVHRLRAFDIDGDGKPEIVHVPLMGRDSTAKGNWLDGRPVRVMAYKIPKDPEKAESWKPTVLVEELHAAHNFYPVAAERIPHKYGNPILVASYEGVSVLRRDGDKWATSKLGAGNQANPQGSRGASEVKQSADKLGLVAAVEPWHGNQVVVYTPPAGNALWDRHVVDDQLRWGHAVSFADLDGDGTDELVVGVRDDPNPKLGDKHTDRRGVRIYKNTDGKGAKWERSVLEDGGVAVEDLTVADLDGDGKPDIVACGRQTKNVRIYWNQGKPTRSP
ncbi:MAG: repeat-containing protein [Gemmataceae bacterium]|nr:repeat-containing protein [Gemmataceae bacterium]